MAQYLMSVWHHDGIPTPTGEEMEESYAETGRYNDELKATGNWVFAGGLHPVDTASVVDATGETITITDGPFAEAKEVLGGFWVIEAPDLDAALNLAKGASKACREPVEVRPFQG